MKKCTNCNQSYPDNVKFCGKCGVVLVQVADANNQPQVEYFNQNGNNSANNPRYSSYPNSTIGNNLNSDNIYNQSPDNPYEAQNQNTSITNRIMPWLPLIISIVCFLISWFTYGLVGFVSIVSLFLLWKNKNAYKYPMIVTVISIIDVICAAIAMIAFA